MESKQQQYKKEYSCNFAKGGLYTGETEQAKSGDKILDWLLEAEKYDCDTLKIFCGCPPCPFPKVINLEVHTSHNFDPSITINTTIADLFKKGEHEQDN